MAALPRFPLFTALASHPKDQVAIVHSESGAAYTYGQLVTDVSAKAKQLYKHAGRSHGELGGERVAIMIEHSYDFVVNVLSIIATDAIAVPLAPAFPAHELQYILENAEPVLLLSSPRYADKAKETVAEGLSRPPITVVSEEATGHASMPSAPATPARADSPVQNVEPSDKGGLMLYTSGTTSRPKGVVLRTSSLNAQCVSLNEAWSYSPSDHLLHVLPLHHIHGVVNAILAPLLAGAAVEFLFPFNPDKVWSRFAAPFLADATSEKPKPKPVSFFTVVPTVYNRLLATHGALPDTTKQALEQALAPSNLRLNISGSAALPTPIKHAWSSLSEGNILLERYGMTEVGMALSCGLSFQDRVDGSVGWPLPSVQARLVSFDDGSVIPDDHLVDSDSRPVQGQIQLRGPTIFREYWRNPTATATEFTSDGWFKTGDVAIRQHVEGAGTGSSGEWAKGPMWFIQGRESADIIKTGGEKISALEVEREVLSLPEIKEAAVVGLASVQWGQKVVAVAVLSDAGKTAGKDGGPLGVADLRRLLRSRLVAYKIPQDLLIVDEIPRNAMGKVNKKDLVKQCFGDADRIRRRSIDFAQEKARLKAAEQAR